MDECKWRTEVRCKDAETKELMRIKKKVKAFKIRRMSDEEKETQHPFQRRDNVIKCGR